jgi:hypothetical protein
LKQFEKRGKLLKKIVSLFLFSFPFKSRGKIARFINTFLFVIRKKKKKLQENEEFFFCEKYFV